MKQFLPWTSKLLLLSLFVYILRREIREMGQFTSTGILCSLNTTVTYSCENSYPNCINTTGLDLASLWILSQIIYNVCSTNWRIFDQLSGKAILTCAGCEQLTGTTGARLYDSGYIWTRIALWKIPLINLVLLLSQASLGLSVQVFVIMRLIDNSIGIVQGYFFKIASCQQRVTNWKRSLQNGSERGLKGQSDCCIKYNRWERKWRALVRITIAYDEWELEASTQAHNSLQRQLWVASSRCHLLPSRLIEVVDSKKSHESDWKRLLDCYMPENEQWACSCSDHSTVANRFWGSNLHSRHCTYVHQVRCAFSTRHRLIYVTLLDYISYIFGCCCWRLADWKCCFRNTETIWEWFSQHISTSTTATFRYSYEIKRKSKDTRWYLLLADTRDI